MRDVGQTLGAGRGWGKEVPRAGQGWAHWDVLFQSALWEDSVELRPQGPLRKDGEHHTFQDQGVHALKEEGRQGAGATRPEATRRQRTEGFVLPSQLGLPVL